MMSKHKHTNLIQYLTLLLPFFVFLNSCSLLDEPLTKALTTSANVRLEKIDKTKAIIKYDRGALIEPNGEEIAQATMDQHCAPKKYKILVSGERVSGEKKWTHTYVIECIEE